MTPDEFSEKAITTGPDSLIFRLKMAAGFYNLGHEGTVQLSVNINEGDYLSAYSSLSAPTANFAFSLELSLKAFLKFRFGKDITNNHDLKDLFNQIPLDGQNELLRSYLGFDFRNFDLNNVDLEIKEFETFLFKFSKTSISDIKELKKVLGVVSKHFEKGRYLYQFATGEKSIRSFPFYFFARFTCSVLFFIALSSKGIGWSITPKNHIKIRSTY